MLDWAFMPQYTILTVDVFLGPKIDGNYNEKENKYNANLYICALTPFNCMPIHKL